MLKDGVIGLLGFLALVLFTVAVHPEGQGKGDIGDVVLLEGTAELSSFVSGERFSIDEHKKIVAGNKIRTGANTILDLVLYDGTLVYLKEETSVSFYYLKTKQTDPATRLKMDFGKARITQKKNFNIKNLELSTPCAVLSVVMGDFSVIVSDNETRVPVHSGRVGMVSTNMSVKNAYVGTKNEIVSIIKDTAPSPPVVLKGEKDRWLDAYIVDDEFRRIRHRNQTREIIDWIKRKQGH